MKASSAVLVSCLVLGGLTMSATPAHEASATGGDAPRLVLLVAVDQMRADYLPRFASAFTGGFRRFSRDGAVFTNAHLDHYPTVTAVGHATMLTGAPPSMAGIVGNDWYDRGAKRNLTSVEDAGTRLIGSANAAGSSPHRLRVSTVGDELKMARPGARVVGLSLKDRSAILPAGRMADLALWWDGKAGGFVSSTWYRPDLPKWVIDFNARKPADAWLGREWRAAEGGDQAPVLARMPAAPGPAYYEAVYNSPFGNDLLVSLAEAALEGEALGTRGVTDLLAVSFSCNDAVGHGKGPHSPQTRDMTVRTDVALDRLLATVDRLVGLSRTIVVLTADHGVAPVPEQMKEWKMPGGRIARAELEKAVSGALEKALGQGAWLEGRAGSGIYLNRTLIAEKGLDPATVERHVAAGVETVPQVWRTYTRSQLLDGRVPADPWSRRVLLSFDRERGSDVEILYQPYWIAGSSGTTHGTPYSYDTHIPLMMMGPGIRPGRYDRLVTLNDLAPTLTTLLDIESPSGASGHPLVDALSGTAGPPVVTAAGGR
jgi:predicted AlkP superfamily pyrophosphatase or phosphodiesterase